MKIECLLQRLLAVPRNSNAMPGPGTDVPMPNADGTKTLYKFRPVNADGTGAHVAEVTDKDHIARFKEITEAFAPAEGDKWPAKLPESTIGSDDNGPGAPAPIGGANDKIKPKDVIVKDDITT